MSEADDPLSGESAEMLNLSLPEEANPENSLDHRDAFTIGWEPMVWT